MESMDTEPQFRASRIRLLRRSRLICVAGVFIGLGFLFMRNPMTTAVVSGLGLVGIAVSTLKLSRLTR